MDNDLNKLKRIFSFRNSLLLLEGILLVSIVLFYVFLFITHPQGLAICVVMPTGLWVKTFYYIFLVLAILPTSTYDFINRKKKLYPEFHNYARILNIFLFFILYFVYHIPRGGIAYEDLDIYLLTMFVYTVLNPLLMFIFSKKG